MASLGTPPSTLNLRIVAGEPVDFTVPILKSDGTLDTSAGSPSWDSEAQIRTSYESEIVLFTFTTSILAGLVRVQAPSSATATWQAEWNNFRNRWDLVVTDLDDLPHVLCGGWVYLYPTVTR